MKKSLKHKNENQSLKKLYNMLPRNALLTICKSFVRPHLHYGDIVYNQPKNESSSNKIKADQHNSILAIINAIKRTSIARLYKELGIESLSFRRWFLCTFYKIKTQGASKYPYKFIPLKNNTWYSLCKLSWYILL